MSIKHILFVDDEPLVLQGLQRMLRSQRHEWEMEFVAGAEPALERLQQAKFDVVVSDMRMPGMNGAQFLAQVMLRHPETVRIILSGQADREAVLQSVGSFHIYLSKPCDPDALKGVILRAAELAGQLRPERLRLLAGGLDYIPTLPSLYGAIVDAVNNPDGSIEDIGALVARDIGMSARLLKLANSAFFGLGRPLSHPAEAVTYLGVDTVKSLVLAIGAINQLPLRPQDLAAIEQIWTHSMTVATGARVLAAEAGINRGGQDNAFVAGLLHDLGKLVLLANLPQEYERAQTLVRERGLSERAAEQEVFGATHAEVGGYLLALWNLPPSVVEAVALHHEPGVSMATEPAPLTFVHVANAFTHGEPPGSIDRAYLDAVGVSARLEAWRDAWRAQSTPSSSP